MNVGINKEEQVAFDLLEFGGRLFSVTMLRDFLGCSYNRARQIILRSDIKPTVGAQTGKRYYYRDVAKAICMGNQA